MSTAAQATATVQEYRVYIKATPQAIWDAITKPEWTKRYGYAPLVEYELRPGGKFRAHANEGMKQFGTPDVVIDGEVIEADAPHRLVQTWRMLMSPETHDLTDTPTIAGVLAGEGEPHGAGGGWSEVLSGLKTLLETGAQLPFQSGPEKK